MGKRSRCTSRYIHGYFLNQVFTHRQCVCTLVCVAGGGVHVYAWPAHAIIPGVLEQVAAAGLEQRRLGEVTTSAGASGTRPVGDRHGGVAVGTHGLGGGVALQDEGEEVWKV